MSNSQDAKPNPDYALAERPHTLDVTAQTTEDYSPAVSVATPRIRSTPTAVCGSLCGTAATAAGAPRAQNI